MNTFRPPKNALFNIRHIIFKKKKIPAGRIKEEGIGDICPDLQGFTIVETEKNKPLSFF